ncbi:ABC transporter substrate-binding protein [Cohaesibacter celericrescens]|nr:ABC transporter substrate-binding protein [Cohaesibacter celericrescens]
MLNKVEARKHHNFYGLLAVVMGCIGLVSFASQGMADTLFPAKQPELGGPVLTVYSSLDRELSRPLVDAFQTANPTVALRYEEMQTQDVYERTIEETDQSGKTADIIISSAMDLQMKLANDGYARRVDLPNIDIWPDWASWRDTAFALTFEPAVIVYHKPSFIDIAPPHSRAELIALLRERGDAFFGRIATYDIERAGVGYLFLALDEKNHRDIWDLVNALGSAGVKLYSNSSAILHRVAEGQFALGYNILGSYAANWTKTHPELGIILPSDYTLVMSRIALVPQAAQNPELGTQFLSFLMSREGQSIMAKQVGIPVLHPDIRGDNTVHHMATAHGSQLRPIAVRPSLMVYLDQVKRAKIVEKWNKALSNQ